jgi:hypothetical protein
MIYVRPDNQFDSVWTCSLQDRSRRYKDMSFTEAVTIQQESKETIAAAKQESDYKAPDVQVELEKIVKHAAERQKKSELSNNSQRLKGIRDNRDTEKNLERQKDRDQKINKPERAYKATVTSIHSGNTSETEFDYPDLDDF